MPLEDFHGPTFVAFTDIAGFKQLMRIRNRAMEALRRFYSHGYGILRAQPQDAPIRVDGPFISDCAVFFARPSDLDVRGKLRAVLSVVQSINRKMLQQELMLSTSIAYGHFDYTSREKFGRT
jgi:hypothetical protein